MSNFTFPPSPSGDASAGAQGHKSNSGSSSSILAPDSSSQLPENPTVSQPLEQQQESNTQGQPPLSQGFSLRMLSYKIIENPELEQDDHINAGAAIDLDEIQRRSTLKSSSMRAVTDNNNGVSGGILPAGDVSQGLNFTQIEIPDFDELSNPTPVTADSFSGSPRSVDSVSVFQNNQQPYNSNNLNNNNSSPTAGASSNNITGFSFPMTAVNSSVPPSDPGNQNKISISRIGSVRSIRNRMNSGGSNVLNDKLIESPQLKQQQQQNIINNINTSNTQEVRKVLATELKTPSEYTLHMIFTQFIRLAERKLNSKEVNENDLSDKFIESLKSGSDLLFDKVVMSLGYIAKKKPQQVIDSVMYWRKSKNDQVDVSIKAYNKNRHLLMLKQKQVRGTLHGSSSSSKMSLHSRNTSNQSTSTTSTSYGKSMEMNANDTMSIQFLESQVEHARQIFVQMENRANVSSLLVCRVLIEVVRQIPLNSVNLAFYNTLEENIYYQLKSMDPSILMTSKIKLINWNFLTILLGELSVKRFSRISDKFIADLEKIPASISKSNELHICLLVNGMKRLKLTNYPLDDFEESCGFLSSLAKFFYKSNSYMVINSYCETLSELLLPLCGVLNAETDLPGWIDVIKLILKKVNSIVEKQKYWDNAFTLMCTCLSVAPANIFYDNWFTLIEYNLNSRLYKTSNTIKDSNDYQTFSATLNEKIITNPSSNSKSILIKSLARLVWTYIFRCTESLNKTTKKLDSLFKMLFFQNTNSKKQQWLNYDTEVLKPMIVLLRSIGFSNINYTMENLLLPLMKQSFNASNLDNLSQEKVLIVLKSYIFILNDLITGSKPLYPTNEFIDNAFNSLGTNFNTINVKEVLNAKNVNQSDILYHEEISGYFCKLFLLLDNEIGANTWSGGNNGSQVPATSSGVGSYNNGSTSDSSPVISSAISPSFLASKSPFASFHYFSSDSTQQQTKRQLNINLFAKLVESIPWFYQISNVLPYKKVVEVLTRNSVHGNSTISKAAVDTLKKLCSKKNAGSVISAFSKFAFNFNEESNASIKYSSSFLTSSSEQYQKLLKIYYELLLAWLNFLRNQNLPENTGKGKNDQDDFYILNGNFKMNMANTKAKDGANANGNAKNESDDNKDLELNAIVTTIEQVEGNGLFFLCSRSTLIRRLAVAILKIIPKFDDAIHESSSAKSPLIVAKGSQFDSVPGSPTKKVDEQRAKSRFAAEAGSRLIHILETVPFFDLINSLKLSLSMPERKKLAVLKSKNRRDLLVKLAEADYGVELTLWFKVFPKLLSIIFEKNPVTMALCRSIVCVRLIQIHEYISKLADIKAKNGGGFGASSSSRIFFNNANSGLDTQPEILIEQWKLFLIVACTSLTSTSNQEIPLPTSHIGTPGMGTLTHLRKGSSQTNRTPPYTISSARSVFKLVIPLLNTEQPSITDAIHSGLSCININIFKALVEVIQPIRANWETEIKAGSINEQNMRIRIEVTRILHATSKFLSEKPIYTDNRIIAEMVAYIKTVKMFLGNAKVQEAFDYQKLRRYFCGLLENVFAGIQKTSNPDKWFPFEARSGCFSFLEEWCGHGVSAQVAKKRYQKMKENKKYASNPTFNAAIELEKTAFEYSAVSAMATLCSGAICQTVRGDKTYVVMAFDYNSLISWIKALFETNTDILHGLGRKALKNLLAFNKEKTIFDQAVKEYYSYHKNSITSESYFIPVCEALLENNNYNCEAYEVLVLGLYAVGSSSLETRKMAGKLLLYIEKRFYDKDSIDRYMESICSTAKSIYKKATMDMSKTFSLEYSQEKYNVISLLMLYLYKVGQENKKDILKIMLPWIETITFGKQEYDNGYHAESVDPHLEMILNNMIELTQKCGETHTEEVEALWVALVKADSEINSITILEYIFSICLHKRNAALVESSKQIVNFVYQTHPDIINNLIKNINPKAMIPPDYRASGFVKNTKRFPYVHSLPEAEERDMFSLGQVSTIFLVDLLKMKPGCNGVIKSHLPLLLNISFVLLDHYLGIVRSHAIELLCAVLHEIAGENQKAMASIANLRKHDVKYTWTYDDLNNDRNGARTPKNMDQLIRVILEASTGEFITLQQDWSRTTLVWATTCSVRHIACRSFQAFRSLLSFLDQTMLRDMLHRLSNTISDPAPDIQGFAMQILMSLNAITAELSAEQLIAFPQLFWSAVACLSTIHEKEFIEVLSILSKFISKIDLNSADTISCLVSTFPSNWEGKFEGLQTIVITGLRSSNSWEPTLKLLDRLNQLQTSDVIAGPPRLMLALLANMPRFLHALEEQEFTSEVKSSANILSKMALASEQPGISRIVLSLANNKFRKKEDFISQALYLIKESYFPEYQSQCLVFLLGLLMNKIKWVKLETLELLKYLFPLIDLTREEFQGVGADLLSPLLRLLLTEFSDKALEVLDETDNISGSQLDKDFIRLSLGNRTLRKEYEKIATLFGVPDDNGWSIPMPAVTAATTRNNIHAVYLTCQSIEEQKAASQHPEEVIQFHNEEREGDVQFYDEKSEKRSINNMYATLNYFESFFEADNVDAESIPESDTMGYHDRSYSTETSRIHNFINDGLDGTESNGSYRLDHFNSNNYSNYNNF